MKLRVSGAQIQVTHDISQNTEAVFRAIDFAEAESADILLTPEGSLSGYTHVFDQQSADEALAAVTEKARNAGVGLALGTCFVEDDGLCYNQVRLYDKDGNYPGFHSKILRCGNLGEPSVGEINDYAATPLRTFQLNDIKIGALICNDLWANPLCTPIPDPHLSQRLSDEGVRVIFHAVNGGRDKSSWSEVNWHYHEANLQMRARAGGLWIVTVDNCAPADIPCSAPSGIINPLGEWVMRTNPKGEEFFVYTITESH